MNKIYSLLVTNCFVITTKIIFVWWTTVTKGFWNIPSRFFKLRCDSRFKRAFTPWLKMQLHAVNDCRNSALFKYFVIPFEITIR